MIELSSVESPQPLKEKPAVLPEEDARRLKLRRATRDFESLFIAQMLKNMRRVRWSESEDSFGKDVMLEVADEAVSRQLAETSMLGIGDLLYQRLIERLGSEDSSEPPLPEMIPVAVQPPSAGPVAVTRPSGGPVADTLSRFRSEIDAATQDTGLSPQLIAAVINAESSGNPRAVSPKGAVGLMQLMPGTAAEVGVDDAENPAENILGGSRYLKKLLDRFGELRLALAAYNAGPARVERYRDVPPYVETQTYVQRVMSTLKELR